MNNQLTTFNNDGIEIIINTLTGESFCSIKGYARLSGITPGGVSKRVKLIGDSPLIKKAEIQTVKGLRTVSLISEEIIVDWIIEDNKQVAKKLLKAGVRAFLHTFAGYQVKSTALNTLYPDRSTQYKELHKKLKNIIARNGGGTFYYIKLAQALNRTVGKPEGRTNQTLDEAENLAYCLAMEHALSVALKVEEIEPSNKVILKFIDSKLDKLKGHVQQIKIGLIGLAQGSAYKSIAPTKTKKRKAKIKKQEIEYIPAVGEFKMDLMPGMEPEEDIKPQKRITSSNPNSFGSGDPIWDLMEI